MTTGVTTGSSGSRPAAAGRAWWVVTWRELLDLWLGGRGLVLMLGFALLLSVTTYLVASNQALNFLEQRESVGLTLQVAVAVGGLLALLSAADSISGERERGTLESLLMTPVPRRAFVLGKAAAAMSLWAGSFAVTSVYVWYLGHGVGVATTALATGLLVGSLLSLFLVGLGLLVSTFAQSNRLSLSVTLFALLALYAPSQMPSSAQNGRFGEVLLRIDPFTAGLHVIDQVVVRGSSLGEQSSWVVGLTVAAGVTCGAATAVAGRLSLGIGGSR